MGIGLPSAVWQEQHALFACLPLNGEVLRGECARFLGLYGSLLVTGVLA